MGGWWWWLAVGSLSAVAGQRPAGLKQRHDLYIAGFFPYSRGVPESAIGRGVMPAVKLALDHINDNPVVLRNYRLHMWWNDTQKENEYMLFNEKVANYINF